MLIPTLVAFVRESNLIEGIERDPTSDEVVATEAFLALETLSVEKVKTIQMVYAPGKPIRDRIGMNVSVGRYVAPLGGRDVIIELTKLCMRVSRAPQLGYDNPWREHVAFENLHPFIDGNGRTGRAIWAWHMQRIGIDPFALPFLHRFYYQTLENNDVRGRKP